MTTEDSASSFAAMRTFLLASTILMAATLPAMAQKTAGESRPAVMPFGALGADGAAVTGAGLRLFPAPGATGRS